MSITEGPMREIRVGVNPKKTPMLPSIALKSSGRLSRMQFVISRQLSFEVRSVSLFMQFVHVFFSQWSNIGYHLVKSFARAAGNSVRTPRRANNMIPGVLLSRTTVRRLL